MHRVAWIENQKATLQFYFNNSIGTTLKKYLKFDSFIYLNLNIQGRIYYGEKINFGPKNSRVLYTYVWSVEESSGTIFGKVCMCFHVKLTNHLEWPTQNLLSPHPDRNILIICYSFLFCYYILFACYFRAIFSSPQNFNTRVKCNFFVHFYLN